MSILVDANGRPVGAPAELVGADGLPLSTVHPTGPAPTDYRVEVRPQLPTRVKWRLLILQAMQHGWDPNEVPNPEAELCIEVPLWHLLEVLEELDLSNARLRALTCAECNEREDACVCDAGTCALCGCTEAAGCADGCGWADADHRRFCTRCVGNIGLEDLKAHVREAP